MEEHSDTYEDREEYIEKINKAIVLIRECMMINQIPPHIGISAFSSLTASMFKQSTTYEEYEKALMRIMKQARDQWQN